MMFWATTEIPMSSIPCPLWTFEEGVCKLLN